MTEDDLRLMVHVVLLGLASMAVDIAGIAVIAWHHQGQAILPMCFALFLMLGATVSMAYQYGRERAS